MICNGLKQSEESETLGSIKTAVFSSIQRNDTSIRSSRERQRGSIETKELLWSEDKECVSCQVRYVQRY